MSKARDLANAGTALTTVSATELGYLDGVTSAVQTQINSKIGQSTAINPTIVDAKGDIIAASAADTVSKLTVGANDTVLTADSSTATGLKWATPAAGGITLIETGSLSGSTLTISSIPSTYVDLKLYISNLDTTNEAQFRLRFNGDTGANQYASKYSNASNALASKQSDHLEATAHDIDPAVANQTLIFNIQGYTLANTWKTIFGQYTGSSTFSGFDNSIMFGAWKSTSAINSITMFMELGNFTGTYTLYGVK